MKLSVLIPTYNSASSLRRAIDSCRYLHLGQKDFEIIIADNASTDCTRQLLESLEGSPYYLNLRVLYNRENVGRVPNWNICLQESRGDYLIFLFSHEAFCEDNDVHELFEQMDADEVEIARLGVKYSSGLREMTIIFCGRHPRSIALFWFKLLTLGELPFNPLQAFVFQRATIFSHGLEFDPDYSLIADQDFVLRYLAAIDGGFVSSRLLFSSSVNIQFDDSNTSRCHGTMLKEDEISESLRWYSSKKISKHTFLPFCILYYLLVCDVLVRWFWGVFHPHDRFSRNRLKTLCDIFRKHGGRWFFPALLVGIVLNPYYLTRALLLCLRLPASVFAGKKT